MKRTSSRWLSLCLAWVSVSCGGASEQANNQQNNTPTQSNTPPRPSREHLCDTSQPESEYTDRDTNNDGHADVTRVFVRLQEEAGQTHAILVCTEVDLDHNGHSDVVRRFDAKSGQVVEEQEDRNFDGKMDAFTQYGAGQITEQLIDEDKDGTIDTRIFYRDWCARRDGGLEPCEMAELRMNRQDRLNNEMANVRRVRLPYRTERGQFAGEVGGIQSNAPDPDAGVAPRLSSVPRGKWRAHYWAFFDENGKIVRIGTITGGACTTDECVPDRWDRTDRLTDLHSSGANSYRLDAGVSADASAPMTSASGDGGTTMATTMDASNGGG